MVFRRVVVAEAVVVVGVEEVEEVVAVGGVQIQLQKNVKKAGDVQFGQVV